MSTVDPGIALRWAGMAEELAGVGYWWMDTASQELRWSSGMFRIFGLDPSVVPSLDSAMQFIHPDDRGVADTNLERNLEGTSAPSQTRIIRKSGEIRHIEGRNACEYGEDGSVIAIYGTVLDVTDRVVAEQALAENERRYRLLAENATDMICCFKPDGRISFVTSAVGRLLGYTAADMIGKTTFEFTHPDDRERVGRAFRDYVRGGPGADPVRLEYRAFTRDGRELWLEAHPRTLFDADNRLVEVQDVIRDITARKALEERLHAARETAEAAAAVKAEFLSNISHELRTPLTAIIGFSDLLRDSNGLSAAARGHADRIDSASRALLSLVNGILDFSRLEAGCFTIKRRAVAPASLARECLELLQLQASSKGVSLDYFEAEGVPALVEIDPDACRQVLVNLIGNAVKFTDAGFVRLTLTYAADSDAMCVAVEDSGPGIAASEREKLFHRFSQVDATSTRRHGGTGLGLAICKGLVEAMGGTIDVLSEPGVGSVFSFRIPAPVARNELAANAPQRASCVGARVLLADDNADIRELASAILANAGADIVCVSDGDAAIEAALRTPFDVILLDLGMPRPSGAEVAAVLREAQGPNAIAPIVAFTALADGRDSAALRDAGFDGLLAKPVAPADLIALVAHFAGAMSPMEPLDQKGEAA